MAPRTSFPGERLYVIESTQLRALDALRQRLYSEQRMDGNDMRDAANMLGAILRRVGELDVTDASFGRR